MNEKFLDLINSSDSIALLGHTNPDGDCLGSTLGLKSYILKNYPEKAVNVYLQKPSDKYSFLPGIDTVISVPSDRKYDLSIILDCGNLERTGEFKRISENAKRTFVVDHHIPGKEKFEDSVIVPGFSSTSELVFCLIDEEKIDYNTALCLYTGIVDDTGIFRFSSVTEDTMKRAGFLLKFGFDKGNIIDRLFFKKSFREMKISGYVLSKSTLYLDNRVITGTATLEDMEKFNVSSRDLSGIVAALRETEASAAVFIYEISPNVFKISLRSNDESLDMEKVSSVFGGGGHKMAAGGSLNGTKEEVLSRVLEELEKQM